MAEQDQSSTLLSGTPEEAGNEIGLNRVTIRWWHRGR